MNILFLAPRLPLPADTGGKIRTLNILKQIAKDNFVHLICYSFESTDEQYAWELKKFGIHVTLVGINPPSLLVKAAAVLWSSVPFSIGKYNTIQMRQAIETVLSKNTFHAVHVDHLHMAHYSGLFCGLPSFLDEHNVEYKILERCGQVESSFIKRFLYRGQSSKMKAFESSAIGQFKGVFACSLDDQILISKLSSGVTPTYIIPNGVDTQYFTTALSDQSHVEDALVFTGSMDWLPNDDAITYFCKEILPIVWEAKPSLKLYVVGKSPSPAVKDLAAKDRRVEVTGRVDDVRPFMNKAKLFIVPLRIGGGTRLKILEAMAMSKAVVSTSIGAEGIDCKDGLNIALADSPQIFAQKIISLCDDSTRVREMGEHGRKLVIEKYDWHIVGRTINTIYKKELNAS